MKGKLPLIDSIIASVTAIIGASCCLVPLLLFNFGIGGVWLSNLAMLKPFRPYLISISIGVLIGGGFSYWYNRKLSCNNCGEVSPKHKLRFTLLAHIEPVILKRIQ